MTDAIVWVSRAPMDSTLVKGFTSDLLIADRRTAVDAMERSQAGEALPPERFPREMYVADPGKKIRKLPDLANAGGFWTVSAAVAGTLRTVDLGRTSLYPTKAFRYDRKTPLEGAYFCLNFGERKTAFLPEQSPRAAKNPYDKVDSGDRTLPLVPRDGDIAVDRTALAGSDLWVDPLLRDAFFLSDRLVRALEAARLASRFGLFRCRVVPAA
jgi:hypothetical protein